jgi:hypothetical protein
MNISRRSRSARWVIAGFLALGVSLAAQTRGERSLQGSFLGFVVGDAGLPAEGEVVQIRPAGLHLGSKALRQRSGPGGVIAFPALPTGSYYLEVLSQGRVVSSEEIQIHPNQRLILAISLPELLRTAGLRRPGHRSDDDYRWALRSATTRPILREFGRESSLAGGDPMRGSVTISSGGPQGASGMRTAFDVTKSVFDSGVFAFSGDMAGNTNSVAGRSSLTGMFLPHGSDSEAAMAVSVDELATPGVNRLPNMSVLNVAAGDGRQWGPVHVQYGAMFTTVTGVGNVREVNPYARAVYEFGSSQRIEYRFATAVPPVHFGDELAEMGDDTPRLTLANYVPRLEQGGHQEVSYAADVTPDDYVSGAVFYDQLQNAYVNGMIAGDLGELTGNVMPDLLSNVFAADGGNYGGLGFRLVYRRDIAPGYMAVAEITSGPALMAEGRQLQGGNIGRALTKAQDHAMTLKLAGRLPRTRGDVVVSYRLVSPNAVTPVDGYDDSIAESEPFLNIAVRQPLPTVFGLGHVEALAEIHNLLAQGYVPMLTGDGRMLLLVDSPRTLRGGFRICF